MDWAPTRELKAGLIGAMTGFAGTSKEAEQLFRECPGHFQESSQSTF
jgi:hypothetical protein